MATINFQQTDTESDCQKHASSTVSCVEATAHIPPNPRTATDGGTAGSVEVSQAITGQSTFTISFASCEGASGASWDAGTWTIRVNVTTANMNLTLIGGRICHWTSGSGCVNVAAIGANTTESISLSTAGVKSFSVSGSAATPSAGDIAIISLHVSNGAMTNQAFGWTPSELIDSPFSAAPPSPGDPLPMVIYSGIIPFR